MVHTKFIPFLTLLLFLTTASCSLFENEQKIQVPYPCVDGKAQDFDCENVGLYAHLSIFDLTGDSVGTRINDIWGWTDPETGKEYALVGYTTGVSMVDISNPAKPVVVGHLPESNLTAKYKRLPVAEYPACNISIGNTSFSKALTKGSTWRDMKVYNNHMYVVSDAQAHGMQVFDLTKLREFKGKQLVFQHDALYDKFANAHNIVINEETGFAYAVGVTQAEICGSRDSSGLHMINIQDPGSPEFAGCYIDGSPGNFRISEGYVHDAQCVVYNGPDTEHRGKEVCFNSAEGNVVIADVTDKSNPATLGFKRQVDMQYSHQGWLTEDHSFFLMNDELDELNLGRATKTYVWDVRDLEDPQFVGYYTHQTQSIDHNLYIKGRYAYESNYNAGLQILDLSGVAQANLERIGYFDTQPETDAPNFSGTWSNYPFFKSGVVVLSDMQTGLFIVKPTLD